MKILWLVTFRDDRVGTHGETYTETSVVEMTREEANAIHDAVNALPGRDLTASPVEPISVEDLRRNVGLA